MLSLLIVTLCIVFVINSGYESDIGTTYHLSSKQYTWNCVINHNNDPEKAIKSQCERYFTSTWTKNNKLGYGDCFKFCEGNYDIMDYYPNAPYCGGYSVADDECICAYSCSEAGNARVNDEAGDSDKYEIENGDKVRPNQLEISLIIIIGIILLLFSLSLTFYFIHKKRNKRNLQYAKSNDDDEDDADIDINKDTQKETKNMEEIELVNDTQK